MTLIRSSRRRGRRFQFLDDFSVAAHGPVEALEIAVDDEDQVVELFAGGQRDGPEGFRLVALAVAEEGPNARGSHRA